MFFQYLSYIATAAVAVVLLMGLANMFRRGSAKLLYPPMMRTSHRGEPGGDPSGGRAAPAAANRRVPHSRRKDITGKQVPR